MQTFKISDNILKRKPPVKNMRSKEILEKMEEQSTELGNFMYTMQYFEGADKRLRQVEGIYEKVYTMCEALGVLEKEKVLLKYVLDNYRIAVDRYSAVDDEGWRISQFCLTCCLTGLNRLITKYKLAKTVTKMPSFGSDNTGMETEDGRVVKR